MTEPTSTPPVTTSKEASPKPHLTEAEKIRQRKSAKSVDIILNFPIEVAGISTDKLTVRRIKTKDRLEIQEMEGLTDARKNFLVYAKATGLMPEELEETDASDFEQIQEVLEDFFSLRPTN